ncbi:ROK family protein [Paenibacillus radicis (ex Gao et al. 2016)]|uniref:Sugar kinase n=1 Tax=Paenibacillus radicis (ex Gao et al. 2016) TaxID=1737354 RepID=A0A917GYE8_9BACL|nr:ROK family protein [Paenibacillus radicis (ex Gao et al. 2016)]GGG60369.1 sugar kinase [Paenibacillus radicis (ex Gao et al. 2016)]
MEKSVLAIDLGGTKILIGEVSLGGEVLGSKVYESEVVSQEQVFETLTAALEDYIKEVGLQREAAAIGIGVVGRVNTSEGIWFEIDPSRSRPMELARRIGERFALPCTIGNDVYCATLAEQEWGCGTYSDNFIYMNIGTGIAARSVVNGKPIIGGHFNAGEVGHHVVDNNSDVQCVCGRKGCVEPLASGLGMHNRIVAMKPSYTDSIIVIPSEGRVDVAEIFAGYDQGDRLCIEVVDTALQAVADTIMNMVRFSDPDTVVLGGGVVSGSWFVDKLQSRLQAKTMRFVINGVKKSTIDEAFIGLKGASRLAIRSMTMQQA